MTAPMDRIDRLLHHPLFVETLQALEEAEKDRIFCRHGLSHLLDVARLAWIFNLEAGGDQPKEELYAAALLHDLGRLAQYQTGQPHEEASALLAQAILSQVGFEEAEICRIQAAIQHHRSAEDTPNTLSDLLYRADKRARPCLFCPARDQCHWPEEQKNDRMEA